MEYLKIRNWGKFQHYKDRNPPWIKLHFELLSSEDWVMLSDADRVLSIACMLIASRFDGKIPNKPEYVKRVAYLNGTKPPDFKPLIKCGFLIPELSQNEHLQADASTCKHLQAEFRPETETETDIYDELFELFWKNYPKKVGKQAAYKAWMKVKKPKEVIEKLKVILPIQMESDQWNKESGQYIPNPATYLNQGRWEDEIEG